MIAEKKKKTSDLDWEYVLQRGVIAGLILLFVGANGMVASLSAREMIRNGFNLGQLLIAAIPFIMAYLAGKKLQKNGSSTLMIFVGALLIGIVTAIPSILLLLFNSQVSGINSILVNVDRDWVNAISFDNRNTLLTGSFILIGVTTIGALLGAAFGYAANTPFAKAARAFLIGTGFTLIILMFGETVGYIAQQILPSDAIKYIFYRDTVKQDPALILFVVSNIVSFAWAYYGNTVSQNYTQLPSDQKNISRIVAWGLFAALLLSLPFLIGRTLSDVAVTIGLYIMMGFGLNIAIGLAGLLDLGYVTNYAVGAYVMAVLTTTSPLAHGSFNFWLIIPVCLLAAMFAGFFFAMPVLKMRGDYLAIATLGFGEIIGKLLISDWLKPLIGGAQGILAIPKPVFFGTTLVDPEQLYYIVLIGCVITLFVSIRLNNSRTGRQWMAIREDEDVAAAMGINTARAKLLAFTVSAATGGVAGAIFATKVGTAFPNSFTVFVSINVLSLIIVGGMGSNPGIVVGAIVLIGMPELLREFSDYRFLIYGALLIFMMVNRPEGLWPSKVRQREIHSAEPELVPQGAGD